MQSQYFDKLRELLSLEYNCSPEDFLRSENVLTVSALHEGRRQYIPDRYFFHMVTLGGNTVVTANECMQDFLADYVKKVNGHWLFAMTELVPIERELNKHGFTLTQAHHMFLPDRHTEPTVSYPVRWFRDGEIHQFYGDERFPNAICTRFQPERPDRIVVCAYDGDRIMGMAGCSEDATHWQQIGIDVLPEYRSRGVGTYLVTLLKNKIAEQGDIPFYGTAAANLRSQNIALNCGFKPAWVEIGAQPVQ